jgi:uncharacterized protein
VKLNALQQQLYDTMAEMDIINAHDHLPLEQEYLANEYSGSHFFAGYVWCDLWSAGLSREFCHTMRDPGYRLVTEWWPKIKPYWDCVRHSSYAKPLLITARELYGIEEINDRTIHELADKIRADNKPGLYTRIFEKCRIKAVLNNPHNTKPQEHPLCHLVAWMPSPPLDRWDELEKYGKLMGVTIRSFAHLLETHDKSLMRLRRDGAVGFKTAAYAVEPPNERAARAAFRSLKNTGSLSNSAPLKQYLFWKTLDKAAEFDVPIAIHSGILGDFRRTDPKNIISWAMQRPNTRFDLFHLGIPFARDSMIIAKNEPNVTLNLCWTYVISEQMMLHAINEIIDLVPLNKIIGFGADYLCSIQKTYGHLVLARQILARAFSRRIEEGDFSADRALHIMKMWLYENPARIYKLSVPC